jgi:hypothetical protein
MAQATPTCPRCGQRQRGDRPRFCTRCGLDLSSVAAASSAPVSPSSDTPSPVWPPVQTSPGKRQQHASPPKPPVRPPPQLPPKPPQVVVIHQHVPVPVPMPQPPKAKSKSGCGCLLMIIVVIGIIIAIGASSSPRYWEPGLSDVPMRPTMTNTSLTYARRDAPDIVSSTAYFGTPASNTIEINAKIRSGDEEKVLVAVYLIEPQDEALRWSTPAKAARWVEMPYFARKMGSTADLKMTIAVPQGTSPSQIQISLYNSYKHEVRRQVVEAPRRNTTNW